MTLIFLATLMIILYGNRTHDVISSLQESLEKNYFNGPALIK